MTEVPSPKKKIGLLERLAAPPELRPQTAQAMKERINRWKDRPLWALSEACDLTFHVLPVPVIRLFKWGASTDSDLLCEQARRAVLAEILSCKDTQGRFQDWWVRPSDFGLWVQTQKRWLGIERIQVFAELFPPDASSDELSIARRRVLESSYQTPEFDAAILAIAKFWLPVIEEGAEAPNNKQIKGWLQDERGFEGAALTRIDTLIRPESAKRGGGKSSPY